MKKPSILPLLACLAIACLCALAACRQERQVAIRGRVVGDQGPLPGATVRLQGTSHTVRTDAGGYFTLEDLPQGRPVILSAWQAGYYSAHTGSVQPPAQDVVIQLNAYQVNDNPDYQWMPPTGVNSCYACKQAVTQVWLVNDAHARAATNPRFLSMYNGTDVSGNQSPLTRYASSPDYGTVPLRPDPSQPYFGPGYQLDFPGTAGNCAACHVPGAAVDDPYGIDPNTVGGADAFGVHCDFCHKVAAVRLNPKSGLPFPNLPGVLSLDIRRPFPQDGTRSQLFFGTFDDPNVSEGDTYLPLLAESQFCAPCHSGTFWDTQIYNSFGEWSASPYSDPASGKTCQQCHMPSPTLLAGKPVTNVAAENGGLERDPEAIHAHTFPGAGNPAILQNAVTLAVNASLQSDRLSVTATITNDRTGHHVPTDSPLRQLILLVLANDGQGQPLALLAGTRLPDWCGVGAPQAGYYAGLPGTAYAKVLEEVWTNLSPSGAYWNPTRIMSDNRIPALGSDTTQYVFAAPAKGQISVTVTLLYRRAFIDLMDQKGWDVPDVIMEQLSLMVR